MRNLLTGFSFFLFIISLLFYLPALAVYFIHPAHWWPMGMVSIGFPYTWLATGLVALLIVWIIKWPGRILGLLWLAGIPVMSNVLAFNKPKTFLMEKQAQSLRVMQWNCMDMPGADSNFIESIGARDGQRKLVETYHPDIILLEDFTTMENSHLMSAISFFKDSLGYRQMVFYPSFTASYPWAYRMQGSVIFSKVPIVANGFQRFKGRRHPEHFTWAQVMLQGRPLRLTAAHLQSMHLNQPSASASKLDEEHKEDSLAVASGNKWDKFKFYQPYHVQQARQLRQFFDSCKVPVLLGADLNSVPSSWVYRQVKGNHKDVFLLTGLGMGRTYTHWLPNLRIDYLFTPKEIKVLQAKVVPVWFSDHAAIIADLSWK